MKTILYATDYSKNSVAAFKYAQRLCAAMQTRLVVTHVLGYPIITEGSLLEDLSEIRKVNLHENRNKLEEFCKKNLDKRGRSIKLQIVPVEALIVTEGIMAIANDWHAELIIVGNKGESVLKRTLLGSTTKKLIKKAPCPVLSIPSDWGYRTPKTIVYTTDFEEEDIYAIQKLTDLAHRFKSTIKIVHITTEKEYAGGIQMEWFKRSLQEKITYQNIEFKLLFAEDIFGWLKIYLDDVSADLVAMLVRKKGGILKKVFQADKVSKMESYGEVPLLSFNKANLKVLHFSVY